MCVCICLTLWVSVCACMRSLSCDWLNDFLKGYRATISFWHLITVRSHCAPADPLWYGPCTCPSPLSQVPITLIKPPPPPPAPTPYTAQPLRAHGGSTAVVLRRKRVWSAPCSGRPARYSLTLAYSPSRLSTKYSSEQKIMLQTLSIVVVSMHALTLAWLPCARASWQ